MKRNTILLIVSILILTSFKKVKKDVWIWFPREIGIMENCIGHDVETIVEIKTDSRKKIKIHSFKLGLQDFYLSIGNQSIHRSDTLILIRKQSIFLKLRYTIKTKSDYNLFSFKTNNEKYLENVIKLNYGIYKIKSEEIKQKKEHIINISNNCKDNFKLAFPYGGSVSSVAIYRDSSIIKKPLKTTSYMIGEKNNFIELSKSEIGRYYVDFGACHWRSNFWMTLK